VSVEFKNEIFKNINHHIIEKQVTGSLMEKYLPEK
jgi:hypothetical protein